MPMLVSVRAAWMGVRNRGMQSRLVSHKRTMVMAASGNPLVPWLATRTHTLTRAPRLPTSPHQDLVESKGHVHESLAVTSSKYGLTLKALQPISKDSLLVSLPSALQLAQEPGTDPKSLTQLIDLVPKELWGAKIALKLLYERYRGDESPFAPYITYLPAAFPGIPIFFGKPDLDALEYPPVSAQVVKRCRWLVDFAAMDDVKRLGQELYGEDVANVLSPNTLGWALSAVTSRAFRPGGEGASAVMLPLIDMCNHDFSPNAGVGGSSKASELNLKALRDISPGEDVTLSYGNLPNDFLLLDYGFLVENNVHDTVKLAFDPSLIEAAKAVANVGSAIDDMKIQPWQARALERIGLVENKEVSMVWAEEPHDSPVDERLLAGVRVLCCTKERDLEAAGLENLGKWVPARTGAWETSTLKTLVGMGLIALSQFSGNAVQDQQLLAGDASADTKLAISLRLGKKLLLARAIERMQSRLQEQDDGGKNKGPKDARKHTKDMKREKGTGKGFG